MASLPFNHPGSYHSFSPDRIQTSQSFQRQTCYLVVRRKVFVSSIRYLDTDPEPIVIGRIKIGIIKPLEYGLFIGAILE
jgi:hypothetical protein